MTGHFNETVMKEFTKDDVAEKIELSLGLKTKVVGRNHYVETIAGDVEILELSSLMASYYRFIMAYGYKLASYGLKNKLEEESKCWSDKSKKIK